MTVRAQTCRYCGALNAAEQERCFRCGQRVRGGVTDAGADLTRALFGDTYPVTKLLLVGCMVVFLFTMREQGSFELLSLRHDVALRWGALLPRQGELQPFRYLSANFVHFGAIHLAINAMMLWSFGRALEDRVGGARVFVIFLGGGAFGFLASDVVYTFGALPVVTGGASSGIAALIGAFIGYLFAQKNPAWKRVLGSIVLYALLFAFAIPARINHAAHIGGLLAGGLLGILFYRNRPVWRYDTVYRGVAWVLGLSSVLSVVLARLN